MLDGVQFHPNAAFACVPGQAWHMQISDVLGHAGGVERGGVVKVMVQETLCTKDIGRLCLVGALLNLRVSSLS